MILNGCVFSKSSDFLLLFFSTTEDICSLAWWPFLPIQLLSCRDQLVVHLLSCRDRLVVHLLIFLWKGISKNFSVVGPPILPYPIQQLCLIHQGFKTLMPQSSSSYFQFPSKTGLEAWWRNKHWGEKRSFGKRKMRKRLNFFKKKLIA